MFPLVSFCRRSSPATGSGLEKFADKSYFRAYFRTPKMGQFANWQNHCVQSGRALPCPRGFSASFELLRACEGAQADANFNALIAHDGARKGNHATVRERGA